MHLRSPADLLRVARRGFRHLFLDTTYARYYSPDVWECDYRHGYDLDLPAEDARYGVLVALMVRYGGAEPILDVGCGDGLLEMRYRPVGQAAMLGIDYSETAIERAIARHLPGCTFRCSDLRSFRGTERFSMVVFNETLYYADDPVQAMSRMEAHLLPGGVFVISMFRSLVTARLWRKVLRRYKSIQRVSVSDQASRIRWDIAILARPAP